MVDSAGSAVVVITDVGYDVGYLILIQLKLPYWSWLREALVLRLLWSI